MQSNFLASASFIFTLNYPGKDIIEYNDRGYKVSNLFGGK